MAKERRRKTKQASCYENIKCHSTWKSLSLSDDETQTGDFLSAFPAAALFIVASKFN